MKFTASSKYLIKKLGTKFIFNVMTKNYNCFKVLSKHSRMSDFQINFWQLTPNLIFQFIVDDASYVLNFTASSRQKETAIESFWLDSAIDAVQLPELFDSEFKRVLVLLPYLQCKNLKLRLCVNALNYLQLQNFFSTLFKGHARAFLATLILLSQQYFLGTKSESFV